MAFGLFHLSMIPLDGARHVGVAGLDLGTCNALHSTLLFERLEDTMAYPQPDVPLRPGYVPRSRLP